LNNDFFSKPEILATTFDGMNLSKPELYKLAFSNYYHESDWGKRPLAKFVHDIAMEAGLLDYL
jgi:hypothetical protein